MYESYVIVHRSHDPILADMLGDILRENGIHARVLGTRHGAGIGVAQHILQMHIEVPASQAGAATDFLEAFFEGDGEELLREEHGDGFLEDDGADDRTRRTHGALDSTGSTGSTGAAARAEAADSHPEAADDAADDDRTAGPPDSIDGEVARKLPSPLIAGGATLLLFGGSHLYSQRPWTALALAMGQVVALANILSMRWESVVLGMAMFFTIVLCDAAGGQWAVRQVRRGRHSPMSRQLVIGAVFVAIAGGVGAFLGPRVPIPEPDDDRAPLMQAPFTVPVD